MNRKLQKFLALSTRQKSLLIQAAMGLLLIKLGLGLLGLPRCYKLLHRTVQSGHLTNKQVRQLAQIIRQAGHHIAQANCLPQSLLLWSWLRSSGVPAQLQIGIDTQTTDFSAHAWVEVNGVPLAEANNVAQRFATFDNLAIAIERIQFS